MKMTRAMQKAAPLGSAVLAAFAREIGEEAAIKLSVHYGGRQCYVPRRPHADSDLVRLIGMEATKKLGKRYGGISHTIPLRAGKRARVIEMLRQGLTRRDIAEVMGCTERHVYYVQAELLAAGGSLVDGPELYDLQNELFGEEDEG